MKSTLELNALQSMPNPLAPLYERMQEILPLDGQEPPPSVETLHSAAHRYSLLFHNFKPEESDLRHRMIDELAYSDLATSAYTDETIEPATGRLLEVCLNEELIIGRYILRCAQLLDTDEAAFIEHLTPHFSTAERGKFMQQLSGLSGQQRKTVLRLLYYPNPLLLAGDEEIASSATREQARYRARYAKKKLAKAGYPFSDAREAIPPVLPQFRHSVFQGLVPELPKINTFSEPLARRFFDPRKDFPAETDQARAFNSICLTFFQGNLSAQALATILEWLDTASGAKGIPSPRGLADRLKKSPVPVRDYLKDYTSTRAYRVRYTPKRQKGIPRITPYEGGREASEAIWQALTEYAQTKVQNQKTEILTADEEVVLAKLIERGMWAEMRLAWDSADPEERKLVWSHADWYGYDLADFSMQDVDKEKLETYAVIGREAYARFLRHNVRLADKFSWMPNKRSGYVLEEGERIEAGMQGVIKGVRKFDYKKGYKFSTYATVLIKRRTFNAIFKAWGVPEHVGFHFIAIRKARSDLAQELQREATDQEVAAAVGCDVKAIYNTEARVGKDRHYDLSILSEKEDAPTQLFGENTVQLLEEVFAAEPEHLHMLRLHIERGYSNQEIAEALYTDPAAVGKSIKQALGRLVTYKTRLQSG